MVKIDINKQTHVDGEYWLAKLLYQFLYLHVGLLTFDTAVVIAVRLICGFEFTPKERKKLQRLLNRTGTIHSVTWVIQKSRLRQVELLLADSTHEYR